MNVNCIIWIHQVESSFDRWWHKAAVGCALLQGGPFTVAVIGRPIFFAHKTSEPVVASYTRFASGIQGASVCMFVIGIRSSPVCIQATVFPFFLVLWQR
jgi:hypothetical protein